MVPYLIYYKSLREEVPIFSFHIFTENKYRKSTFICDVRQAFSPRGRWGYHDTPQILADQLSLSQPGGRLCPPIITGFTDLPMTLNNVNAPKVRIKSINILSPYKCSALFQCQISRLKTEISCANFK